MRWACSGCLRLLPHEYFNNHALLRLRLRKPLHDAESAKALTSWEPTWQHEPRAQRKRRKQRQAQLDSVRKKNYHKCVTARTQFDASFFSSSFAAVDKITLGDLTTEEYSAIAPDPKFEEADRTARWEERRVCGSKRFKRTCNECRFQAGHLRVPSVPRMSHDEYDNNTGSNVFPMLASRRVNFSSEFDRYFPNLTLYTARKRPLNHPPIVFQPTSRFDARTQFFLLHMARCPKCTRWQELRFFGPLCPRDIAAGNVQCYTCLSHSIGRRQLAIVLDEWFQKLSQETLRFLEQKVDAGFNLLQEMAEGRVRLPTFLSLTVPLLQQVIHRGSSPIPPPSSHELHDLSELRERHRNWLALAPQVPQVVEGRPGRRLRWGMCLDPDLREWTYKFDDLLEHVMIHRELQAEIAKYPQLLVDWALSENTSFL